MSKFACSLGLVMVWACGGCAAPWQYDYDAAIQQARKQDSGVLVLYKDPMDSKSGEMRDILQSGEVASRTGDMVRCLLVPHYAPHRRFMGQYGIESAPAIVVVHPDQTYHALAGEHTKEEVLAFLDSAEPPGQTPRSDPQVPRSVRFSFFNVYEKARDTARRQNRPLLIVYKWWLDPKSTELIDHLAQSHVTRFLTDKVCCILDWDYLPNRRHVAAYGVEGYPALILVEPSGQERVLSGLRTPEEIIRFLADPTGAHASR